MMFHVSSSMPYDKAMKVLAIDPGYDRLGVAIIERLPRMKEAVLYSGCIETSAKLPHASRLGEVSEAIERLIEQFAPDAFALETLYFSKNQKTALLVAEARGAALAAAARRRIKVYEYSPAAIKIAVTGYGKAEKKQVSAMVEKLVKLPPGKRLDDEYDAIATGLAFFATERFG
jgi:crossover junction endodeoxyribonuclease RuvC